MKIEPNHTDEIFRQRLHDVEVAPPPFVWPNVERELKRQKRKRFFMWLFALMLLGIGAWNILSRRNAAHIASPPEQVLLEEKVEAVAPLSRPGDSKPDDQEAAREKSVLLESKTSQQIESATHAKRATSETRNARAQAVPEKQDIIAPLATFEVTEALSAIASTVGAARDVATLSLLGEHRLEPLVFTRKNDFPYIKTRPVRKKQTPKHCYDFAKNPNVWMLDAYMGPSFSSFKSETNDPSSEPYRQRREATEQSDWAFNAGLRGSLLLGRHFLLRSGVHYEQMTDVFEHFDPNYVKYIVEITQVIVDNKPVIIADTIDIQYGESYVKTYNRYGLLDIPFEIGGEIRSGRFGLSLQAGASLNVFFWKRGTFLSDNEQPTPFTPGAKGGQEIYRPRVGLSAGASAQTFFHLRPRLRVFAEPYFRQILHPLTLENQSVQQRRSNWGVKIGVTKIFD
ncbi:MAG: hypothetical protein KF734_08180 [Saprospiraceae bacterium]|nr:hypothetical protein [Saprospiraceae bacterium]